MELHRAGEGGVMRANRRPSGEPPPSPAELLRRHCNAFVITVKFLASARHPVGRAGGVKVSVFQVSGGGEGPRRKSRLPFPLEPKIILLAKRVATRVGAC